MDAKPATNTQSIRIPMMKWEGEEIDGASPHDQDPRMNQNLTQNRMNPAVAATRALAKARMGDVEALRYLVEQRDAGDTAATRALESYRMHAIAKADASALSPN